MKIIKNPLMRPGLVALRFEDIGQEAEFDTIIVAPDDYLRIQIMTEMAPS